MQVGINEDGETKERLRLEPWLVMDAIQKKLAPFSTTTEHASMQVLLPRLLEVVLPAGYSRKTPVLVLPLPRMAEWLWRGYQAGHPGPCQDAAGLH